MASKELLQKALNANFDLAHFHRNVLQPVFGASLEITSAQEVRTLNASEKKLVRAVRKYGKIKLTDYRELDLYDVELEENVIVERNKVSIGSVIKKYIIGTNAVLVNFHYGDSPDKSWRLSFIAKEHEIEDGEIKKSESNPKRYTYVLGAGETCRTAAERFAKLSLETEFTVDNIKDAFSVEKLSKLFFDEYKKHYEEFVAHLNKREIKATVFKGDEKAIRDFAKKLLGRIVFLCFVQKKGWLGATNDKWEDGDKNFLQNLFIASGSNENFYPVWLRKLFYDTLNNEDRKNAAFELPDKRVVKIPYLNGGLFEDDEPQGILTFPKRLFENLFEFFNLYNFTIYEDSPEEHTIAVDPEMLGHIFENLLEDNKDKGAFYTPAEIVHYMCQESITEYLFNKLNFVETDFGDNVGGLGKSTVKSKPGQITLRETQNRKNIDRAHIEDFVKNKNANDFIVDNARSIDRFLDEVKICDPAIGSGAFPMGLLHEIYQLKMVLHDFVFVKSGELFHIKDYDPLTYHARVKENIIQNSIYGVDIEKGAVDIARLRFWLSLVVDESTPRALPNLDYKIVVGNSLIPKFEGEIVDIDWELADSIGEMRKLTDRIKVGLNEIVEKQNKFFSPKANKPILQLEIRNSKIDLVLNQLAFDKLKYAAATAEVQDLFGSKTAAQKIKETEAKLKIAGYNNLIRKLEQLKLKPNKSLEFFDWKLDFPEIMNPAITGEKNGFDIIIANPPYDVYEGKKKNEIEGLLSFEIYHKCKGGKINAYELFLAKTHTLLKNNGVNCQIFQNSFLADNSSKGVRNYYFENQCIQLIDSFPERDDTKKRVFESVKMGVCILLSTKTVISNYSFNLKVHKDKSLSNFFVVSFDKEEIFEFDPINMIIPVMEQNEKKIFHKYHKSKFNMKYAELFDCLEGELNMTFHKSYMTNINTNPLIVKGAQIQRYYVTNKPSQGEVQFVNEPKYLNDYSKSKKAFHHQIKRIALQGISGANDKTRIISTLIDENIYCANSCNYIIPMENNISVSIYTLLGVFNSKLTNWIFRKTSTNSNVNCYEVNNLKLPLSLKNKSQEIESIVKQILALKIEGKKSTAFETQIDLMVYHLYNLTYAEAKIIDAELSEVEFEKYKS